MIIYWIINFLPLELSSTAWCSALHLWWLQTEIFSSSLIIQFFIYKEQNTFSRWICRRNTKLNKLWLWKKYISNKFWNLHLWHSLEHSKKYKVLPKILRNLVKSFTVIIRPSKPEFYHLIDTILSNPSPPSRLHATCDLYIYSSVQNWDKIRKKTKKKKKIFEK